MKLESPDFTEQDLTGFVDQMVDRDRQRTAERLRAGTARLRQLGARVSDAAPEGPGWNAKETLAHIAVFSKAYGYLGSQVAKGRLGELQFTGFIGQRDLLGTQMSQRPVAEILEEALAQQEKALAFLESASPGDLRRTVVTEAGPMSAESFIRLPLVAHLEEHLDQLEAALG
ncbi:MAG: DinB family protein [Candidatus Dormibacteria bacterium]